MRVLLHIGMPKTGSTALQTACTRHAATLAQAGVLYPSVRSHPVKHHFFSLVVRPSELEPMAFGRVYVGRPDLMRADFDAQWNEVKRQIRRHAPHTLVLSSETLFHEMTPERAAVLRAALAGVANTLEIVAYVRRPSAFYLSSVQERLKKSAHIRPPAPLAFRAVAESWSRLLEAPVRLAGFDRSMLKDGDIFRDFCARFLPEVNLPEGMTAPRVNETVSAELMTLLQDYRRINHPELGRVETADSNRYRRLICKAEAAEGCAKRPKLRADIAQYIDQGSVDLLWLDETCGIRFDGIDYAAIRVPDDVSFADVKRVTDLCEVDTERMQALQMRAANMLLMPRIALPESWRGWLVRRINTRGVRWLRWILGPLKRKLYAWF